MAIYTVGKQVDQGLRPGYWRALLRDGIRVGVVNSVAGSAVIGEMTATEARQKFPQAVRMINHAERVSG